MTRGCHQPFTMHHCWWCFLTVDRLNTWYLLLTVARDSWYHVDYPRSSTSSLTHCQPMSIHYQPLSTSHWNIVKPCSNMVIDGCCCQQSSLVNDRFHHSRNWGAGSSAALLRQGIWKWDKMRMFGPRYDGYQSQHVPTLPMVGLGKHQIDNSKWDWENEQTPRHFVVSRSRHKSNASLFMPVS